MEKASNEKASYWATIKRAIRKIVSTNEFSQREPFHYANGGSVFHPDRGAMEERWHGRKGNSMKGKMTGREKRSERRAGEQSKELGVKRTRRGLSPSDCR